MSMRTARKALRELLKDPEAELRFLAQRDNRLRHQRRGAETQKSLAEIRNLESCEKSAGLACACGSTPPHKRIKFKQGNAIIAEMCPKVWYRKLVRKAYEETGNGTAFSEQLPLSTFLRGYRL